MSQKEWWYVLFRNFHKQPNIKLKIYPVKSFPINYLRSIAVQFITFRSTKLNTQL